MAQIHATVSAVVTVNGVVTPVRRGDAFDEGDQIVRDHPGLFVAPVEEATANPGQKRSTRR